ncbi:MAG: WD40 repeat domain-containing protein, partial [Myxococcota bacterium]|nr:WD40 repeat domain-containing protein [Myxococcota bacterium]
IPRLHELTTLLEQGGTEAACARIDLARSQPLRLSDRALLDALSSALSAHHEDLDADPSLLPAVVYPFLLCASLEDEDLRSVHGELPLPKVRLRFPVVLPGDDRAQLSTSSPVLCLASSPGGLLLAAATQRDGVLVWESAMTEPPLTLGSNLPTARSVAWVDADHLLTGHDDGTVRLWKPAEQTAAALEGTGTAVVRACAGSPTHLASCGDDGTTRVWPRHGGTPLVLSGQDGRLLCCAAHGPLLAVGSSTGEIVLWNLEDFDASRQLPAHDGPVRTCRFHPEGHLLFSTSEDLTFRAWHTHDGSPAMNQACDAPAHALAISPGGSRALTGGTDQKHTLWDLDPPRPIGVHLGHRRPVTGLAWGPDPHTIWSSSSDRTIRAWGPGALRTPGVALHHSASIRACEFSPDGRTIVGGSRDGRLSAWDVRSGRARWSVGSDSSAIYDLSCSPDGTRVAIVRTSGRTTIRTLTDGSVSCVLGANTEPVTCCAFLDDHRLLTGGRDNQLRCWDLGTRSETRVFEGHTHWVRSCAVSGAGTRILSGGYDHHLRLWDLQSGETLCVLGHHDEPVIDCVVDAGGTVAVSAGLDGRIATWDLPSGTLRYSIDAHGDAAAGVALLGEDQVVSIGQDRWVRGWDLHTGAPTFALPLPASLDAVDVLAGNLAIGDRTGNLWVCEIDP